MEKKEQFYIQTQKQIAAWLCIFKIRGKFFKKKSQNNSWDPFFFSKIFQKIVYSFTATTFCKDFIEGLIAFFFFFETIQNSTSEIAIFSKYKAFKRLTKQREYNSTSRVLTKEKKFGFQNTGFLFPSVNQSLNSVLLCSLSCTLCSACCSQHSLSKKIST